jgi:hypothetical protein
MKPFDKLRADGGVNRFPFGLSSSKPRPHIKGATA